jgi:Transposase DNA-binding/Transposase Tn5 dimerisation domain
MLAPWVMDEMKTVKLHDKRLDARLRTVLAQLADRPMASIPAACGGHAEMTAAYRLFDNEKATFDNILEAHADATRQRIAAQSVVIFAQDTTEVNLTRPGQVVAGVGPLDGNSRVGALLHLLHAFTPDGTPLGTVHALAWARDEQTLGSTPLARAERAATPIEEKESYRWVTTMQHARRTARDCPTTTCVCVADSEADIYELFVEGMAEPKRVEWIVRACQNRALSRETTKEMDTIYLREHVLAQPVLFNHTTKVRGREPKVGCETRGRRQARESRTAEVSVRAARVALRPPYRPAGKLPAVTLNVVLVHEAHPPAGEEPIEWLLLTSLPIDNLEQVRQVIQYYCTRWMIEVFFRVLKSGCRVEERRFEALDRLLTCLAVYLIVAWRSLYVCRLGRSCPAINCETVFEPAEWKAVWKVVRRTDPPADPPRLDEMVRLVAQLGGYVNRTRAAPPGPQTLWIGLQRAHDFALCWQLFGPGAPKRRELV